MKVSLRIGVKSTLPFGIFPNAAIFVKDFTEENAQRLMGAFAMIREVLAFSNYNDLADKFICEVRTPKPKA